MGLLSGLFGGGGSSSSTATTTDQSTTVTTTTETDIINSNFGFTGRDAVELAAVIESGATQRLALTSLSLDNLLQLSGKGFNQLIGGAGALVSTGAAQNIATAGAIGRQGGGFDFGKYVPLGIAAIAAIFALRALK